MLNTNIIQVKVEYLHIQNSPQVTEDIRQIYIKPNTSNIPHNVCLSHVH